MGQIWVREFTGGLDARRMAETTPGGVLIQATNGHITRGGEFEKRAAFVKAYTLPAGTVGLAHTRSGLTVFGSAVEPPGMPSGVSYQRLQHPGGSPTLSVVPSYDLYSGNIYAAGLFSDGSYVHFYDGSIVEDWFEGRARASFRITAGSSGGSGAVTNIKVGGVSIIDSTVSWTTSHAETAEAIAVEINNTLTSPEYTAVAFGDKVIVAALQAGTAANDLPLVVTESGDLVATPDSTTFSGGVDGTFSPGPFVKTIGAKMNALSGSNWHFSGINLPTGWTTENVGAGFVDLSTFESGSEELIAIGRYQDRVAIFSADNIQLWYVDPDPALNQQTQVLNNTGTLSPRSVTQFGDSDLFYLHESGLRSLRARDSSNAASTTDIGNPVDTLIVAELDALPLSDRNRIFGLIEPREGRYWITIKSKIFVFSFFSEAKVSAWSIYETVDSEGNTFEVDEALVFNRRVYLRSGDTIYVYGGLGDGALTYDATEAVAQIPYLDADDPTRQKSITGVDLAAQGTWQVYAAMVPNNPEAQDKIGVVASSTFNENRIPAQGSSTHFSLIFKSQNDGYARLGSCVIHYESSADEDGSAS